VEVDQIPPIASGPPAVPMPPTTSSPSTTTSGSRAISSMIVESTASRYIILVIVVSPAINS
jgi:hypothetical protein